MLRDTLIGFLSMGAPQSPRNANGLCGAVLNRKIDDLIHDAGFSITQLSTGYARGLRPMAYMYEEVARL